MAGRMSGWTIKILLSFLAALLVQWSLSFFYDSLVSMALYKLRAYPSHSSDIFDLRTPIRNRESHQTNTLGMSGGDLYFCCSISSDTTEFHHL